MPDDARETKWTPEQLAGIRTTGVNLLISAAAGSGKTAVLAERCAYLVCDAPEPCGVDELLVVTFTEAAAAEMKSRIEQALRRRLDGQIPVENANTAGPSPAGVASAGKPADKLTAERVPVAIDEANSPGDTRLLRQLALIGRAQVSTLHGFCARLLRQHFHLLGLDPNFTILDGDEAALLRLEVAQDLFAERYETDEEGTFQKFIDSYGDGDDEALEDRIISTHELLCSLADPAEWLAAASRAISEAADLPLRQSELGQELLGQIRERLARLVQACSDGIAVVQSMAGFEKYAAQLAELSDTASQWTSAFGAGNVDALAAAIASFELPRKPGVSNAAAGKVIAVAALDAVRDAMNSKSPSQHGSLFELCQFSEAQWRTGMRQTLPSATLFLDLLKQFAKAYRAAKDAVHGIDFSDLETHALKILRDADASGLAPSAVARRCQRQYQHVLVDEYQDINEVQDAILSLVSRDCMAGKPVSNARGRQSARRSIPNLFCVGDVKQSIYRFRLAEPARFLQRYDLFKSSAKPSAGIVIDLQANFRSRAPLLEVLNGVFRRLMTRAAADIEYDESHELRAGLQYPAAVDDSHFLGAPIELHLLPCAGPMRGDSADDDTAGDADPSGDSSGDGAADLDRSQREAVFIARRIKEMFDKKAPMQVAEKTAGGTLASRPIEYRDVVILLRSMRYKAEQFAEILRRHGIPVHTDSRSGYFESMEVRDMLSLLRILDNQQQDIPLAAVLRSPLAALAEPEDCLARIRLAYPPGDNVAGPVPFHQAVVRYAAEQHDELAAALNDFLDQLRAWRQLARQRPLAELIWTLYEQTGYLAFCGGLKNGQQRIANLISLHERAGQFGTFSRQGLYRFLKFMKTLESETDMGLASVQGEADQVVRIMSIHRSKGLEFPAVFLPDLAKKINLQDCSGSILVDRHRHLGLSVVDETLRVRYPSLASLLVQDRLRRQSLAEELRVLYVAMTRAREHLILVGTCDASSAERWTGRYANHSGPMPPDVVLGGNSMLDWIGPVAAAMAADGASSLPPGMQQESTDAGRSSEPQSATKSEMPRAAVDGIATADAAKGSGAARGTAAFDLRTYTAEEVAGWSMEEVARDGFTSRQAALAALKPLVPAPPASPLAEKIIGSLIQPYAHEAFAHLPAAQSVSGWTKGSSSVAGTTGLAGYADEQTTLPIDANRTSAEVSADSLMAEAASLDRLLPTLRFQLESTELSPADRGTATHLVLEKLDFKSRPCTGADLEDQINLMVQRKLMTAPQAKAVNRAAIEWMMQSELGALIKRRAGDLLREVAFNLAVASDEFPGAPPSGDPMDQIMIRGRMDLLIPVEGGFIVVDYKTDNVRGDFLKARAAFYAGQVQFYRRAVKQITGQEVTGVFLVFLTAHEIHES